MERLTGTAKNTKVGSHFYYYADGRRIGDVSDDPSDNTRVSYAEQLATKRNEPADRRTLYRSFKPVSSADFDQNFEPINESYPAASASSYTIRGGEDLPAIAQSLWGDRAMWYLIAEANGLRGNENLQAGQVLVIPNKVTNIHNNAETFRPYNAGEAIGKIDPTLPTAPPPPTQAGDKGCGTLGTVIMVVIAVVVTYYTGGAASMLVSDRTPARQVTSRFVGIWACGHMGHHGDGVCVCGSAPSESRRIACDPGPRGSLWQCMRPPDAARTPYSNGMATESTQKTKKSAGANLLTLVYLGSPTWARTRDLRINSRDIWCLAGNLGIS